MDNGEDVVMCCFDFSKAFNIVNHMIPCEKLAALGISPKVVVWDRKQPSPVAFPSGLQLAHNFLIAKVNDLPRYKSPAILSEFCYQHKNRR